MTKWQNTDFNYNYVIIITTFCYKKGVNTYKVEEMPLSLVVIDIRPPPVAFCYLKLNETLGESAYGSLTNILSFSKGAFNQVDSGEALSVF